jgi:hypothetical protein
VSLSWAKVLGEEAIEHHPIGRRAASYCAADGVTCGLRPVVPATRKGFRPEPVAKTLATAIISGYGHIAGRHLSRVSAFEEKDRMTESRKLIAARTSAHSSPDYDDVPQGLFWVIGHASETPLGE